jgi:D-3-phosphoglycerate dehydrogenase
VSKPKVAFIGRSEDVPQRTLDQFSEIDHDLEVHVCSSYGETIEAVKGADIIINAGVPMPREVIQEIDRAQAIVSFGHGFDRIDDSAATDQGVMVVNTAGFCTEEVSNHAIMLLLACAKKLAMLDSLVRAGEWGSTIKDDVLLPMGPIDGQTLGLVGLGNIACATARKAQAFGLELIAYDPFIPPWTAKEFKVELVSTLEELAGRSDFVSVHVPLNDHTRGLIDAEVFAAMKPTAYLINTCRGPTVDEKALIEALESGQIAGAGLDVFEVEPTPADNPLLKMDNVVLTPHSAGTSTLSMAIGEVQIGRETARLLQGTWPMSVVNPAVKGKIANRPAALNI